MNTAKNISPAHLPVSIATTFVLISIAMGFLQWRLKEKKNNNAVKCHLF